MLNIQKKLKAVLFFFLLLAGIFATIYGGDKLREQASDAWLKQAGQDVARITDTGLFWLSSFHVQLRGFVALFNSSEVNFGYFNKNSGCSVRCLRDSSQFGYLTISDKDFKVGTIGAVAVSLGIILLLCCKTILYSMLPKYLIADNSQEQPNRLSRDLMFLLKPLHLTHQ